MTPSRQSTREQIIAGLNEQVAELQAQVEQLCGDLKAMQTDYHNEHKKVERLTRERDELSEKGGAN